MVQAEEKEFDSSLHYLSMLEDCCAISVTRHSNLFTRIAAYSVLECMRYAICIYKVQVCYADPHPGL